VHKVHTHSHGANPHAPRQKVFDPGPRVEKARMTDPQRLRAMQTGREWNYKASVVDVSGRESSRCNTPLEASCAYTPLVSVARIGRGGLSMGVSLAS
jgi:hypothetical protein